MPDNLNLNLNLDQNLNLNLGATRGTGVGPRYNTEDFCRLSPLPPPAPANLPTLYAPHWDPEHRAWWYVHEFITDIPWFLSDQPIWSIWLELILQNHIVVPNTDLGGGVIVANVPLDTVELGRQLLGVLHASNERADRGAEIVDQASALGALSYWTGMLRIDPAKEPNTCLLIRVARKIGEFVAMGLKELFRMRRPAQIYPWIMPLIDGPDTPSFPSSHALQAHLISDVLKLALGNRGQIWGPPPLAPFPPWPLGTPPAWPPPLSVNQTALALDHLAERVGFNREVAGVHYPMDSAAGRYVARFCAVQLYNLPAGSLFQDLVAAATAELVNLP